MKRLMRIVLLAGGLAASGTVHASERTATLAVENMTCAACPYIVRKAMASVPGVTKVDVSYAQKTAVVTFEDNKTTLDAIAEASASAGYPARALEQGR